MEKDKHNHKVKNKIFGLSFKVGENKGKISALLGICIFVAVIFSSFTIVYTQKLQTMVDDESYEYLEEISTQINTNLNKDLYANYAALSTLSNKVKQNTSWSLENILEDLNEEASIYSFHQLALIDENGDWYASDKVTNYASLLSFVNEMHTTKKNVTSSIVNIDGKDSLVFLHPLDSVSIEGHNMIGLGALIDMETLNEQLDLSMFNDQGYVHIVRDNGNIVIRANNVLTQFSGYNLFAYLQDADIKDDIDVDMIKEEFAQHKSRKIQYTRTDGLDVMAIYTPTGYDDWYLYAVIPTEVLTARSIGFYRLTQISCAVISEIFLVLVLAIFAVQMRSKKALLNQLYTDNITGGRSLAKFEIDAAAQIAQNASEYSMIYANVNRFKILNEQLGREEADKILSKIYDIIDNQLGPKELVARVMADHFGILLHSNDVNEITAKIDVWNELIKAYLLEENIAANVQMTYGVYQVRFTKEITLLLDKANLARKTLNNDNSDQYIAIYDDELERKIAHEQSLEDRQEIALSNHEYKMFLQPKYNPDTGAIAGAEALTRWIDENGDFIYPDEFIPLFEANGFIVKLDLYIFTKACEFIRQIIDMGVEPIPVSVNLSRLNLVKPDFLHSYINVWERFDIPADLIEFEITENLIFDNMIQLNDIISEIHKYGFKVSMDDFGSGYSSLNMLKNMDIDVVKLDRKFFTDKDFEVKKSATIIKHMIELAKDLGMVVVSEGVEYQEQVEFLKEQKCDLIQGFFYSRPIPSEQMVEMLKNEIGNDDTVK